MYVPSEILDGINGQATGLLRLDLRKPIAIKEMSPINAFNEFWNLILAARYLSASRNIQRAIRYVDMNYLRTIKLTDAAAFIGVHPNYLCRKFRAEIGLSFHEYMVRYRVQKAMLLLVETEKSVKQVGYEVGFSCPEAFSKAFKRRVGCSPGKYRNRHRHG
jgi:AraC-like DNA-binding protein